MRQRRVGGCFDGLGGIGRAGPGRAGHGRAGQGRAEAAVCGRPMQIT